MAARGSRITKRLPRGSLGSTCALKVRTVASMDCLGDPMASAASVLPVQLHPDELSGLTILDGVARESVWGLLEHCPVRHLRDGEVLLAKGEENSILYLLLEGLLSVHLESSTGASVAVLEAGVSVGELSVIDGSPASAYVVSQGPSRLLAVGEETFWRLVRASHRLSTNLLLLLAERMRATNQAANQTEKECRKLERATFVDALTGVNNRRWLEEKLPRMIERQMGEDLPLSLAILDVDHFKRFNDTHGHAVGDLVLESVGSVIRTRLRPFDVGARYGGEEFVIVFPATDISGACSAAERVRNFIASAEVAGPDGQPLRVTVSVGVAQVESGQTAKDVIRRADVALYRAKKLGRNRVEVSL